MALDVLFQRLLPSLSIPKIFVQGVSHIAAPVQSPVTPRDLKLIVWGIQGPPFNPIWDISLSNLTYKVVFLVTIGPVQLVSELVVLSF